MGVLETTLVGGAAVIGGVYLVRRVRSWENDGSGPAGLIVWVGTGAADEAGKALATGGKVTGAVVRTGGTAAANVAGTTLKVAAAVSPLALVRAVRPAPKKAAAPVAAAPATPASAPAKKAPAKKAPAKKTAAKKTAAKKSTTAG